MSVRAEIGKLVISLTHSWLGEALPQNREKGSFERRSHWEFHGAEPSFFLTLILSLLFLHADFFKHLYHLEKVHHGGWGDRTESKHLPCTWMAQALFSASHIVT